jgi:hypothetical protein
VPKADPDELTLPIKTYLDVPDERDQMSEAEQDAVPDGMIDQLVAEQGLEPVEQLGNPPEQLEGRESG